MSIEKELTKNNRIEKKRKWDITSMQNNSLIDKRKKIAYIII